MSGLQSRPFAFLGGVLRRVRLRRGITAGRIESGGDQLRRRRANRLVDVVGALVEARSDRGGHPHFDADHVIGIERPACRALPRSEENTSELQSLMRISYAVFCLK